MVLAAVGEGRAEDGITFIAPRRGRSVWIGDRELGTFKETGENTVGLFALVGVMGLPGSGPPPHMGTDLSSAPAPPTPEESQRIVELGRKYDTEYPPVPGW